LSRPSRLNRLRALRWLPVYYLIVVAAAYFLQDFLLYHPRRSAPDRLESRAADLDLRPWPRHMHNYRGWVSRSAPERARAAAVVFHGNAGAALDRHYYIPALEPLGCRVVLAEYPGYGARPGSPSERTFVEDGIETLGLAFEEFGAPLFLIGESLGCGVAASLVGSGQPPPLAGVVLITPWDNLPDLAQSLYWFLPARLLVRDRYDSAANLRDFRGRVAVALAERDEVIPPRHTMRLYESLPEPKRLWTFPEARHNTWPSHPDASWWSELFEYLLREPPGP
jgi:uncharacterized protein